MKKNFLMGLLIAIFGFGGFFIPSAYSITVDEAENVLVINEIDYDQVGADNAEFIELKNIGTEMVNLGDYELKLFNGSTGSAVEYKKIVLSDFGNLDSLDYFVICGDGDNVANCDLVLNTDFIQNGPNDAVGLFKKIDNSEILVDSVSYEGNLEGYTETEGAGEDDGQLNSVGLSRYPDGIDTDNNKEDFVLACITPGEANVNYIDCDNPPTNDDSDKIAPEFNFIDPTPTDGAWINYNNPTIKIQANESLSKAHLNVKLLNGGFENANMEHFGSKSYYWPLDNSTKRSGSYSARSSQYFSSLNQAGYSSLTRTIVLDSPSNISFWWKVSSEENGGVLSFYINDELKRSISGEIDWSEISYNLPAGSHNLVWEYRKDSTTFSGSDAGWVDDISINGYEMIIDDIDNSIATYEVNNFLDGEYIYSVEVYDLADNKTVSDEQSFKVDTVAPTGNIWIYPHYHNKETAGEDVKVELSLRDRGSYVKNVCLWLGDEEENLLDPEFDNCKDLEEKTWNSYNYAPGFNFDNWDSTKVADGSYNLYAIATDNAGNEARISRFIKLNNHSEGSAENPSEISTCEELQAINNNLNWHYKLMNDIDCSETKNWNYGRGFVGIGDTSKSFTGSLDGQNFHINNLYQDQYSTNSGVFYSMSGTVKNVNFRNVDIKCNSTYCGAFTYYNTGIIEKSSITGDLQCSGKCGGFASQQSGIISECWGDMEIGSGGYQGGIAGQNFNGYIKNSYFKGNINAANGGGLVGLNEGGWGGGKVENSYSNTVMNDSSYNGGLIGWMYQHSSQTGSYWNKDLSGLDNMCGKNGTNCLNENGLTDEEMKIRENFVDWDFEVIWAIDPEKNDGYPYLQWQTSFSEIDIEAPIITLLGEETMDIYVDDTYNDAGATALDNVDGDISSNIVVNNSVDTSILGSYTITYNVNDSSGNSAEEVIRYVNVIEKTTPSPVPDPVPTPTPTPTNSGRSGGSGILFIDNKKVETTFQIYNPETGETTIKKEENNEEEDNKEEKEPEKDSEKKVLGETVYAEDLSEAEILFFSGDDKDLLFTYLLKKEDLSEEARALEKYSFIFKGQELSDREKQAIINFIYYGTPSTLVLGEGERAGVINSYLNAFSKLPRNVFEWEDIIKIANGRWPGETNSSAEERALEKFKEIYLRDANRENKNDDAAVTIIAYGLRPTPRNLDSERKAIKIFEDIFKSKPASALDWDGVRAIAYSGATR